METNENKCTCNEAKMKTVSCFHCKVQWQESYPYHEKIMSCPQHRGGFAYCGGAHPPLCQSCHNQGYFIEAGEQRGYFSSFVVKKKTPQ